MAAAADIDRRRRQGGADARSGRYWQIAKPVGDLLDGGTTRALTPGEKAAYDAPFPDGRYQMSALQFPLLIPVQPDNPGVPQCLATWDFLATWEKPFLTVFGTADAVAYKPGSHLKLQRVVPGAAGQPHLEIEGANHFSQEDAPGELVAAIDDNTAAVVVQYPNFFGTIEDLAAMADADHAAGAYLLVVTAPVPLSLLKPPGAYGADFVTAEGQSLGVAQSFGGPYVGLLATKQEFVRQLPGRLVGMTSDSEGKRGYVLALQTREQHIRREKATSHICTNQGLSLINISEPTRPY